MADERTVFLMEQQPGSVRVVATGAVTHDMLDALMGFVHRARKRKDNFQEAAPSIDCLPPDNGLPEQVRDYGQTEGVGALMRREIEASNTKPQE